MELLGHGNEERGRGSKHVPRTRRQPSEGQQQEEAASKPSRLERQAAVVAELTLCDRPGPSMVSLEGGNLGSNNLGLPRAIVVNSPVVYARTEVCT